MQRIRILPILAAAALAAAAAGDEKTVTLARTVKSGDVVEYKIVTNAEVLGGEAVVTQKSKVTVKEVKPNGDVVWVTETSEGKITFGGMEQEMPAQPPVTEIRSKTGRLVEYNRPEVQGGLTTAELEKAMSAMSETLLPEKPVAPGETWTVELDNPAVKDKKITVKTTFVGTEKVGEADAWKVQQKAEADADDKGAKLLIETTAFLDPATGLPVKSETKVSNLPTNMFGPISFVTKMERIKKTG